MTLVLFSWATNEPFFKDLTDTNLRKVLYEDQFKQIEENLTPFGVIDDGVAKVEGPIMMGDDLWFNEKSVEEGVANLKKKWLENV